MTRAIDQPVTIWAPRPAWFDQAACRGMGPTLFFPPRGDLYLARAAQAVCAGCPVQHDCLDHAVTHIEAHGIWGGTTDRDRRSIRAWGTTTPGRPALPSALDDRRTLR